MIKLAIADDHKLVLNGIENILKAQPHIELIAAVDNGKLLLDVLALNDVDIALVDIDMPIMGGLEVVKQATEKELSTRFIILSVHDEKPIIQKAFLNGAYGYLLKRSDPQLIIEAINKVYTGKKYFDEEVMNISIQPEKQEADESDKVKLARLSNRELEIIKLIIEGFSNLEISEQLFISKRTVDTHRNNFMKKLGFNNSIELVKFGLKNGLGD